MWRVFFLSFSQFIWWKVDHLKQKRQHYVVGLVTCVELKCIRFTAPRPSTKGGWKYIVGLLSYVQGGVMLFQNT